LEIEHIPNITTKSRGAFNAFKKMHNLMLGSCKNLQRNLIKKMLPELLVARLKPKFNFENKSANNHNQGRQVASVQARYQTKFKGR